MDWVAKVKDDRDCHGRRLGGECHREATDREDHADLPTNQIGDQIRCPIVLAFRPAVFDRDVLALDIAGIAQAPPEGDQTGRNVVGFRRPGAEPPDHRHRLLRWRRKRPSERPASDESKEFAPPHLPVLRQIGGGKLS